MITREQAEAAVIRARSGKDEFLTREIRILELLEVDMQEETPVHEGNELGQVEYDKEGWSCTFQWRDKFLDNPWNPWDDRNQGHCYVVEPKPGPYVIK